MRRGDDGVAMISVMMISLIATTSVLAVYQIASHELNETSQAHERVSSIGAAEAGLDLTLATLGTAPLPCTVSGTLAGAPQSGTYAVAVSYYATYPATGSPLSCTPGIGPSATPAAALLRSTGSTGATVGGERVMEALVKLTPLPTGSLDKALFSDRSFQPTNSVTLYGNVGNDADIYTNGNFACANNEVLRGSVFSQGTLSASNNCTVLVDYYARGNVTLSHNVTVGHDAKSSRGNIALTNSARVEHDAIANGTNTGGTVVNNRVSGATLADPPSQVFPTLEFDLADWTAAGWTRHVDAGSDCALAHATVTDMSGQTAPTVLRTSCAMAWSGNTSVSLGADLAIFSTAGFTASNNFTVRSTNASVRKFYLIVPTSSGTANCTAPGISLRNNTTFQSSVQVMLFTPCQVSIANNDAGYGQIYGGVVTVSNNFTLRYRPASIPGVEWIGGTATAFSRDLVYKREVVG